MYLNRKKKRGVFMVLELTDISSAAAVVGTISLILLTIQIIPLLKEVRLTVKECRKTLVEIRELSEKVQPVVEKANHHLEEFDSLKLQATHVGQTVAKTIVRSFFPSDDE